MKLYGVLDNEKRGREARKGSDEGLTLALSMKGRPLYRLLMTPMGLQVRDEQTGKFLLDVRHDDKSETQIGS